ncbi:putative poly [ADP-ribose] polymerase 3 [Phtheirospermum japonicum]|uniref:Putative poly [ADP-ribose] polymerase 3 n=1 Tax=Phtheirospermum japonicum TaxID=374723 RepID=A0A830DBE6_9LAMI|nr:putative poly [ADP-ribose] polymerase 3 [Phtheirospermum japonicum]
MPVCKERELRSDSECQLELRKSPVLIGPDIPCNPLLGWDDPGEEILVEFVQKLKASKESGQKEEALWSDFSQRIFTLMPSTRPYVFRDFSDIADHVSIRFLVAVKFEEKDVEYDTDE